jgi:hypothetical protein
VLRDKGDKMNTENLNDDSQEKKFIELTFSASSGIAALYLAEGYSVASEDDMFVTVRKQIRG